jgi:hypothetical protein
MNNSVTSAAFHSQRLHRVAANDSLDDVSPTERLSWLVELMSRYAREFMQSNDGHESPRLAAAIGAIDRCQRSLARNVGQHFVAAFAK